MSKIFQTFRQIFAIKTASHANTLLYYLKRIPLIGSIFPDSLYADGSLKQVLTVFVEVCVQFGKFFIKGLYLFGACVLPLVILEGDNPFLSANLPYFIHLVFFMSCILGPLQDSAIFTVTMEKIICLRYLRMDPRSYVKAVFLEKYILHFLYFLPMVVAATLLLGGGIGTALLLWLLMIAFRFAGEAFQLWLYDRTGKVLSRMTAVVLIVDAVLGVAAYLPLFLQWQPPTMAAVFSLPGVAVCLVLGAFCCWYILIRYPRYRATLLHSLDEKFLFANQVKASSSGNFRDVKMKDRDFVQSEEKTREYTGRLKGFHYLNAIFFSRHRRLLFRPVAVIIVAAAILFAGGLVFYQFDRLTVRSLLLLAGQMLPAFVFIMYLVSMVAERACRAMFYNCDISLLRYGFYRRRDVILQNFNIRLLRLSAYTFCASVAIDLAVLGLVVLCKAAWNPLDMLMFGLSIPLLGLLFTVHHLFMYYVFQPYTTELNIKNPFFNFINGAVYLACFLCLQIRTASRTFTIGVLIVTILYILAALLLVYRFAPKTFRVK